MSNLIVASAQQQMRLFDAPEDYRKEMNRFLHMARAKGAQLVVFPELSGVMASTPMVEGFRMRLLKQARKQTSLWARARSALAGGTASLLRANFRKAFESYLQTDAQALAATYETTFRELAQSYEVTIVAGSAYLADAGVLRHRAMVFGPDGTTLGFHDKAVLGEDDQGLAQPGRDWTAVNTPIGRLGVLFGAEILHPEAGRLLGGQGAELMVALSAVTGDVSAAQVRGAAMARAQENRCFVLTSFMVGPRYLSSADPQASALVGKSGIYGPLELTPHHSGVLVEMGTGSSEGLLTAELDLEQVHSLWDTGDHPWRTNELAGFFSGPMAALYAGGEAMAPIPAEDRLDITAPAAAEAVSEDTDANASLPDI